MPKIRVKTLCTVAIMAALYFLLNLFSIRAGNLRVTFASLPVIVAALLLGPWQAAAAAFLGEFLNQLLSYGFTATTALWLIPPAVRGLIVGTAAVLSARRGRPLENRAAACYGVCLLAAILTTACNTAVILLDSLLFHYYTFAAVFGSFLLRLTTGVVAALVVATAAMPLTRLLRRTQLVC